MRDDLHRATEQMRTDLLRVEILTAALSAFSRPIPDYEPTFHHLGNRVMMGASQLRGGWDEEN
jgi:hypothetical protein